jgi:hypothetical protein
MCNWRLLLSLFLEIPFYFLNITHFSLHIPHYPCDKFVKKQAKLREPIDKRNILVYN